MAYLQDLGCHLDVSEHNLVVLGLGFAVLFAVVNALWLESQESKVR